MILRRGVSWGDSAKQWALELNVTSGGRLFQRRHPATGNATPATKHSSLRHLITYIVQRRHVRRSTTRTSLDDDHSVAGPHLSNDLSLHLRDSELTHFCRLLHLFCWGLWQLVTVAFSVPYKHTYIIYFYLNFCLPWLNPLRIPAASFLFLCHRVFRMFKLPTSKPKTCHHAHGTPLLKDSRHVHLQSVTYTKHLTRFSFTAIHQWITSVIKLPVGQVRVQQSDNYQLHLELVQTTQEPPDRVASWGKSARYGSKRPQRLSVKERLHRERTK